MSLNRDNEPVKRVPPSAKKIAFDEIVIGLLKAIESADYQSRVDIENDLVKMGKMSVKELVVALDSSNRLVRSHSAMALIRIGDDSIQPLLGRYKGFPEYSWMLEFIVSEITGSTDILDYNDYCESLAS
ncbi:MAG: hypothetical protein AB7V50_03035 [Vampirovibrionia bacterium]